jgi:hypothetical protein
MQQDRYLRVFFTDRKLGGKSTGEFYFTPDDTTVQFRVGSLSSASVPLPPSETLNDVKWYKRNFDTSSYLCFGESESDTFGPGSAALGPPAEMRTGEIEGRQDVDPKLKIDFMQQFPFSSR